jgi:hypothetical protein
MVDLSKWIYKKRFRYTGSVDGTLDLPVIIDVNYVHGITAPDFKDVRFILEGETEFLTYNRLGYIEGISARFIVEILDMPVSPGEVNLIVLAGNPEAEYEGIDISDTFFVEKFEGTTLDINKWDVDSAFSYNLVQNEMQIYSINTGTSGWDYNIGKQIKAKLNLPNKFKVLYKLRNNEADSGRTSLTGIGITDPTNYHFAHGIIRNADGTANFYNEIKNGNSVIAPPGTYFEMELRRLGSNKTLVYRDGIKVVDRTDNYTNNKVAILGWRTWTHADYVGIKEFCILNDTENPPTVEDESEWLFNFDGELTRLIYDIPTAKNFKTVFCIRSIANLTKTVFNIRGLKTKDIRLICGIKSVYVIRTAMEQKLQFTITEQSPAIDIPATFMINGFMMKTLLVRGWITYDPLGLPGVDENVTQASESEPISEKIENDETIAVLVGGHTYV